MEFACCKQNIIKKKAKTHANLSHKPTHFFKRTIKEGHSVGAINFKKATTMFYSKHGSAPTLFKGNICSLIGDSYWVCPLFTCNPTYKVNDKGVCD